MQMSHRAKIAGLWLFLLMLLGYATVAGVGNNHTDRNGNSRGVPVAYAACDGGSPPPDYTGPDSCPTPTPTPIPGH